MSERIRFHLDENVDPVIAKALSQHGIDVTTTIDAGLRSKSDDIQFAFARNEGRVLVTHDADFLRLASSGQNHPGIAYCHLEAQSIGEIIRSLRLIYEVLSPGDMEEHIEYL